MNHLPRTAMLLLLLTSISWTACQKAPPVSVGQRESAVGQGIVIIVTNTSEEHLHDVKLTIKSPAGEVKTFSTPTLEPHESLNVGWLKLEGWPIPKGSEVTVSCKDYSGAYGPVTI